MNRYIDADALCKYTNNQKDNSITANDFMRFSYIDIVRCKECVHNPWEACGYNHCWHFEKDVNPEDFCSHAERRRNLV